MEKVFRVTFNQGLQSKVKKDYEIVVGYHKCQYIKAGARAKVMLQGDGVEQYKSVFNYEVPVRKYNPGSRNLVCVRSAWIDTPLIQSMFMCFKPIIDSFIVGCRPIIGLNGCHLIEAYPSICLTILAKDGNNSFYPLAQAIVRTIHNNPTQTSDPQHKWWVLLKKLLRTGRVLNPP